MLGELFTRSIDTLPELLHPEIYAVRRQIHTCQCRTPLSTFTASTQPYIDISSLPSLSTMRLLYVSKKDTSDNKILPFMWIVKGQEQYGKIYTAVDSGTRLEVRQWACPRMLNISHPLYSFVVPDNHETILEILDTPKATKTEKQVYIDPWCLRV
ncbi:MAG: hypothetical protein NUV65_02770 [Candidatus Roizmanbacteria bacterium]|nr:hypothetical protein [Candidatus Roizmanbacteria bacterium]